MGLSPTASKGIPIFHHHHLQPKLTKQAYHNYYHRLQPNYYHHNHHAGADKPRTYPRLPHRWFHRHTFESLSGANPRAPNVVDSGPNSGGSHVWAVAAGSVLSAMVTLLVAALLYKRKLKPRLIRRMKSHSG